MRHYAAIFVPLAGLPPPHQRPEPLALLTSDLRRPQIEARNPAARARMVDVGASAAVATALCPELTLMRADAELATAQLQLAATIAYGIGDSVQIDRTARSVSVEIGGSRALHGSLAEALARLDHRLRPLSLHCQSARAPTRAAAVLAARLGGGEIDDLPSVLDPLAPHLVFTSDIAEALVAAGLTNLGLLRKQPSMALARRYGPNLIKTLTALYSDVPTASAAFVPAADIEAQLSYEPPVDRNETLRFDLRRLLAEIEAQLTARDEAVGLLALQLELERGGSSERSVGWRNPVQSAAEMLPVVDAALMAMHTGAAVTRYALKVVERSPRVAEQYPIVGFGKGLPSRSTAIETIRARLGAEAVQALRTLPDHRPERSNLVGNAAHIDGEDTQPERPLWLWPEPRPIARAQLQLLGRGERIESGWWDGADARRDYYVASAGDGSVLWVYQDLRSQAWYVHGYFG